MSTTFVHPWYLQQPEQESITTAESESTLRHPQERLGETLTDFEELIWVAGLFEGEGTLYFKEKQKWSLAIEMTDIDVLERFSRIYGLKVNGPYSKKNNRGTGTEWKDAYRVGTSARDKVFQIVCDLYPYLGERRREKCDEFLQWYAAKTGKRYD